jgi:hypothetical protein
MALDEEILKKRRATYYQWVCVKAGLRNLQRLTANMDKVISLIDSANERQINSPKFWEQIEKKLLLPKEPWKLVLQRSVLRHEGMPNQFGLHREEFKLPEGIE